MIVKLLFLNNGTVLLNINELLNNQLNFKLKHPMDSNMVVLKELNWISWLPKMMVRS